MCVKTKEIYFAQNTIIHMTYVIEDSGKLVNAKFEEQPLNAGNFALV